MNGKRLTNPQELSESEENIIQALKHYYSNNYWLKK